MPMRIRMAMHGPRHQKIFHLVAINSKQRRNARPAELLGIYDPHAADGRDARIVRWSVSRIHHWLNVGALPSKSAVRLLELGGILKPGSPYHPKATQPKYPVVEKQSTLADSSASPPSPSTT
ncbi:ribosomal protein S16 domain-containing protein [Gymnopilus junonius]|uniref:Ribosomal protein S16 domain-containing protein n=1 Tax=Gymnopilus junonius TaxID=109634 RepID=A0A9P5NU93_GYMJU|nr:ribosomal protein S16 domain-containing protein [Gymnopilus junonius]KAF8905483.1 ribosomal protein S16 domain-containing protein [Gymnopilus junonius]